MTRKHAQTLFRLFFLIALLLLVCVEGFHHHQDNILHSDCALCVAAQQTAVVTHHAGSLVVSHDVQIAQRDSVPALVSLKNRRPSFVRGPPA